LNRVHNTPTGELQLSLQGQSGGARHHFASNGRLNCNLSYEFIVWEFAVQRLDSQGPSMLKLTSRLTLESLPSLLSALVAAVVVPGFIYLVIAIALPGVIYSPVYGTEAMAMPNVPGRGANAFELIRQDRDAFTPDQMLLAGLAKAAEDNLVNR
jgi:hypothetical protein